MTYGQDNTAVTRLSDDTRRELDRFNARMRHFQGVAASVMDEAMLVMQDIWEQLQDPRTPEEIIDGLPLSEDAFPACGWPEFMEKLHLLAHFLDYTKRLCDGSIYEEKKNETEV